jgi:hypothetical protein
VYINRNSELVVFKILDYVQCDSYVKEKYTWWWPVTAETYSEEEEGQRTAEVELLHLRRCLWYTSVEV